MKQLLFSIVLSICFINSVSAQYRILYKFEYQTKDGLAIPAKDGQHILYQDYYVMNGMTKSVLDVDYDWITINNSIQNKRTEIDFDGNQTTTNPHGDEFKLLSIDHLDTVVTILGYECKAIELTYEKMKLTYFYSDELSVSDPSSFANGKHLSYGKVMKETNGAIELKYIVETEDEVTIAEPLRVEKVDLSPDDFNPKKVAEQQSLSDKGLLDKLLADMEAKYSLEEKPISFEADASFSQGKMSIPVNIKVKQPNLMLITMSFNGVEFKLGFNDGERWEYNPMEDNVKVEELANSESESYMGAFAPMLRDDWEKYDVISMLDLDSCYRVVTRNKESKSMRFYYFDKGTYYVHKHGNVSSTYRLDDYTFFEGLPFPQTYAQLEYGSQKPSFQADINKVEFNVDLADSIFEVPGELESKIVKKQKEKPSEDYYNEAEALAKEQKYDEAIKLYKKAIAQNSSVPVYHNQLGLAMLNTGDYYGAIAEFSKALDIYPDYHTALNNLGYTKMNMGDYEAAIADISKAIALDDENSTYFSNRGLCYYNIQEYDSALIDFKVQARLNPTGEFSYWNVGMSYYNLEEYDSTILYFNKSEENKNTSGSLYNYRGICYYQKGSYEKALDDFKKAVKSEKPTVDYFANLGNTYSELDNSKKAVSAFEQAIELDSTYAKGHNSIGLEYLDEGSYDAAITSFSKAIAINDTEAVYFDNRGKAKASKMDYVGAIEDFSQSISLYPDDANIYYLRGLAKKNISEKFDACRDFKKAADLGLEEAAETIDEFCVSLNGN